MTTSDANLGTSTSNVDPALTTRVLEQLREGVLITDAEQRIVSANPAFTRLTGYTEAELLGQTPAILRSEIHSTAFFTRLHQQLEETDGWEGEIWNRRKEGQLVLHYMSISVIRDEQGQISHYLALLSERLEEQAEQERQQLYQELFSRNPAPQLLVDTDSGAIVDANPAALAFYGYSLDAIHALTLDGIDTLPPTAVQAEMARARSQEQGFFETQHRLANGELRTVKVYAAPVAIGNRSYLHAIIHDITDSRAYHEQLQAYKRLFDRLPVGVYRNTPGPQGRFLEANPAMARLFEADSVAELLEHPIADLYESPQQRSAFSADLQQGDPIRQQELRLRTLRGNPIWVAVTAQRGTTPAGQEVFDGVVEDITPRKVAEQQLAREREVGAALRRILAELITAIHTPDALFERVCAIAVEEAGFRLAWIGRPDAEDRVVPEVWAGQAAGYLEGLVLSKDPTDPNGQGPAGTALREDRAVVVQDLADGSESLLAPWRNWAERFGLCGAAVLPFHRDGRVAGALHVYADEPDFFTDAVVDLLRQITQAMGTALDNYDRHSERNRLIEIMEASPDYISMANADGRVRYINAGGLTLFGYPPHRNGIQGPLPPELEEAGAFQRPTWASRKVREEGIPEAKARGYWSAETALYNAEGTEIPVSQIIVAHYDPDGSVSQISTIARDISRQKRMEGELRLLAAAFNAGQAVLITAPDGRIERVNRAFTDITGFEAEEVVGRTPRMVQSGYHDRAFYDRIWNALRDRDHWEGEIWNRRKNGEVYPEWESITAVRDGNGQVEHYVAVFHEISEQKRLEAELEREASFDRLTGVYNRLRFEQFLDHEIERSNRYGTQLTLIMFDIDHFKAVNDTYGHDVGDRILEGIAETAERESRQADLLARWGGEEFMLLLPDTSLEAGLLLARRLRAALAELDFDQAPGITISLGVSTHEPGETAKAVLKRLDNALYAAKEGGRDTIFAIHPGGTPFPADG